MTEKKDEKHVLAPPLRERWLNERILSLKKYLNEVEPMEPTGLTSNSAGGGEGGGGGGGDKQIRSSWRRVLERELVEYIMSVHKTTFASCSLK